MAISPLALGIGLQGKYDYKTQAALEMSRAKGRAKAEADAETAKAKKRAPYERALMKVDTSGLLPYQAQLIKQKYADALQSFEDSPDDYSLHATNMQDINSSSKAFRDQAENYKRLSMTRDRMPSDDEALAIIGTLSDPKAIQEELGKLGPASSVQFANDQFLFSNRKYQGTGTSIDKFIDDSMFAPDQGVDLFKIGNKQYAAADIDTQVPAVITANIMNDDSKKQSAINDYLQYAQSNNIPYDFSTKEGSIDFLNKTTEWVNQSTKDAIAVRRKTYNAEPRKATIFNIGTAQNPAMNSINYSEEKDINVGKGKFRVMGGAVPNMEDAKLTLPYDSRTFYAKNGERVQKSGLTNITYNRPALGYVAKEDYNFPATRIKLQNGQYNTIPAKKFYKGQPLLDQYALAMAQQGKAKAGYVVFGMGVDSQGSPQEIIRDYSDLGISKFLNASAYDRNLLNQIDENAAIKKQELQAKIDSYNQANAAAPKIDIPTQQGDVKKEKAAPAAPKPSGRMRWDAKQNKMIPY
jgi:hypothetical protein